MLTQLSIKNIVLIESSELTFSPGLCVLSGETGAGKSILLDALGLVLGARADSSLIRSGEQQGSVSAEFDITGNPAARAAMEELGLAASDTLILRRSISADGKTRCHANDEAVTVAALRQLGEMLVEVHGQHDQRSLQDATVHRELLDSYGGLSAERAKTAEAYRKWNERRKAVEALKAGIEQAAREQDYLRHMCAELKELNPEAGEEERLTTQRSTMMQSEKLFEVIHEAIRELTQGKGVLPALHGAQRLLSRSPLSSLASYPPVMDALDRASIEAQEALDALERAGQEAVYDPQKLEEIEERLFALKAAARKYNMPVDELANLYRDSQAKLTLIDTQEHELAALEKQAAESRKAFVEAAQKLSAQRAKVAAKLEKSIEAELAPLKMQGTKFRVRVAPLEEANWSEHGRDSVHFECATNVGKGAKDVAYASLKAIASGGELSRFMLALKVVLSASRSATTLIFDEIDTGTGGAVADAIGARLAKLGANAQVLVVTHLPQVAARGSQHLLVSKQERGRKIVTQVESLSAREREEELARMLAGATITPEARSAAKKLLEEAA